MNWHLLVTDDGYPLLCPVHLIEVLMVHPLTSFACTIDVG